MVVLKIYIDIPWMIEEGGTKTLVSKSKVGRMEKRIEITGALFFLVKLQSK
jgi:hypothetical protein